MSEDKTAELLKQMENELFIAQCLSLAKRDYLITIASTLSRLSGRTEKANNEKGFFRINMAFTALNIFLMVELPVEIIELTDGGNVEGLLTPAELCF